MHQVISTFSLPFCVSDPGASEFDDFICDGYLQLYGQVYFVCLIYNNYKQIKKSYPARVCFCRLFNNLMPSHNLLLVNAFVEFVNQISQ